MNLQTEILKEHSKRQAVKIGSWVGNNRTRFKQLMELFLSGDYRVTQRSAWIVSYCGLKHPELVYPWFPAMLKRMQEPGVHIAVKRNVLRILEEIKIPRTLFGPLMSICFDELASHESTIAVKVYSMSILAKIAKEKPAITRELQAMMEQMLPQAGPGIRARIRKVLRRFPA